MWSNLVILLHVGLTNKINNSFHQHTSETNTGSLPHVGLTKKYPKTNLISLLNWGLLLCHILWLSLPYVGRTKKYPKTKSFYWKFLHSPNLYHQVELSFSSCFANLTWIYQNLCSNLPEWSTKNIFTVNFDVSSKTMKITRIFSPQTCTKY